MRYDTINFLSDYGRVDEFVAVVKSVIWSTAPDVRIVDITHDIAAHNVRSGALALARAAPYLNPGIVVADIDPGVGGPRPAIAVEVGDGATVLIGPDNGLLAPTVALVGGATAAVDLTSSPLRLESAGATFNGRDLYAPIAAHLANGAALESVGEAIDPAGLLPAVMPVSGREGAEDETIVAEVLWVDRFGNLELNVDPDELDAATYSVRIGDRQRPARRVTHFEALASGELGLLVDSSGLIAIVANRASAAAEAAASEGTEVRLTPSAPANGIDTPVTIGRPA